MVKILISAVVVGSAQAMQSVAVEGSSHSVEEVNFRGDSNVKLNTKQSIQHVFKLTEKYMFSFQSF